MLILAVFLVVLAPAPLRLPEVLAEVDRAAPAVDVARAEVAVRRAAVGAVGAWEDPRLSVMTESIPLGGMGDADPVMIRYRVGQELNLFGRRRLAKQAAGADVTRAGERLRRTRWDARAEAVRLFYELWMVDEMRRIVDEQLALLDRMRDASLALVRAGMGSMGHHDFLRAESQIAAMTAERASLDDERAAVAAMLNTLRGRDLDEEIGPVELPADAPLPALDVVDAAAGGAPEAAEARAMRTRAEAERGLARRMGWPMVMVEAEYMQQVGMTDGVGFGIMITVPLWRERARGEIAMAGAMERAAEREEDAMTKMAAAELRMAWSRARGAERQVEVLERTALPRLRETIASVEAAYVAGTTELISLLDAVMELQELEMRRARAVAARGVARFELDRIAGRELAP